MPRYARRSGQPTGRTVALLQAQTAVVNVASLPAPIGGWNARDSIANMPIADAVTLENWFPGVSNVTLRGGYSRHVTGITGQVESLFNYAGAATQKLIAAVSTGKFYDVTSAGAVGAAVVSGLTNGRWEHQNIATSAGNYMYCVNGVDNPQLFDGTTWTAITAISVPAITGVTTTTLDNVTLFKNRLWFIEKNTLKAWYLPTSSIGGAAQVIDMSSVARLGGYLVSLMTWTIDAGYGVDDNLVFITSAGEIIVWRGTDPASAATFALVGVYSFGQPVGSSYGKRCLYKYGGDILVLSQDGLFPLSSALQSVDIDRSVALTDKIRGAFKYATQTYASTFGWCIVNFPKQNATWVNIPVTVGTQQQYVMNNITKAWCNFTGWNANCWQVLNDNPYFGGNGFVGKAWDSTYADNSTNIATNALQAFN